MQQQLSGRGRSEHTYGLLSQCTDLTALPPLAHWTKTVALQIRQCDIRHLMETFQLSLLRKQIFPQIFLSSSS